MATTVCHISTVHPALDVRVFHKECQSLRRAGYEVHLIAPHPRDECLDGIHIHGLPTTKSRMLRIAAWPVMALVKALRLKAAVYHLHDPELLFVGVLLRAFTSAKVIYDMHEDTTGQILTKAWVPAFLRLPLSVSYHLLEAFCTIGAGTIESDMIAGRSRQPKQSVRNLPLRDRLPLVARNPADFARKPILVYAGELKPDRGAWLMLGLARSLRRQGIDFEMRLVGRPETAQVQEEMSDFVSSEGLGNEVKFYGQVPFMRSLELITESTLGLCLLRPIPNYEFALPTKILEYMAFGLPVVATNLPCTAAYVRKYDVGVLARHDDDEEIAQAVTELLKDPQRMYRYSINGQQAIKDGLCWENEQKNLLSFYRRMLGLETEALKCHTHKPPAI